MPLPPEQFTSMDFFILNFCEIIIIGYKGFQMHDDNKNIKLSKLISNRILIGNWLRLIK